MVENNDVPLRMTPLLVLLVPPLPIKRRDFRLLFQLKVTTFQILCQVYAILRTVYLFFVLKFGAVVMKVSPNMLILV